MRTYRNLLLLFFIPTMVFGRQNQSNEKKQLADKEIRQLLYTDTESKVPTKIEPNWNTIERRLSKKYGDIKIDSLLVTAKIGYYELKKDWEKCADAYLTNLERHNRVDLMRNRKELGFGVNNTLSELVFKKVNNRGLLKRAAVQQLKVIRNPFSLKVGMPESQNLERLANYMDTYANLLYKAGKVKKAILWQIKAVQDSKGNKEFGANLDKMKRRVPTW